MQKRDIQREASALIRYYARDSLEIAAQRHERAEKAGDARQQKMWRRVSDEIRQQL